MGLRGNYGYLRDLEAVAVVESAYNGAPTFTAGGSHLLKSYSPSNQEERVARMDTSGSRSIHSMIRKRRTHEYTITAHLDPPGGATPPDLGMYIRAAMGTETIGGSSVTYSLAESLPSIASLFVYPGVKSDQYRGVGVNTFTLRASGTDEAEVEFQCVAANHIAVGNADMSSGGTASDTSVSIASGDEVNFELGGIIQAGSDGPHVIDSLSSGSVGFSASALAGTVASGSSVAPYSYYDATSIASSQSVFLSQGRFDLGSETGIEVASFEMNLTNNLTPIDPAFTLNPSDFATGRREVTGNLVIWCRDQDSIRWMRARQASGNELAVTVVMGDISSAGNPICTVSLPRCYLNFPEESAQEDGPTQITLSYQALTTSLTAGDAEVSVVFGTSA